MVCLIGASGSGKSTLLRCLNLLETVDDGGIWFEGDEITDPRVDARRVRGRMGMVFQAYNLFPHMTVLDNLTLAPRRVHGTPRARRRRRRVTCWAGSAWPTRPTSTPTGSPAASSSGPPWPGRWSPTPRWCCSTR